MNARLVQLFAVVACGLLAFVSSSLTPSINAGRQKLNMIGTESVLENTPPEYTFAVQAFGAFRSLITDIAFMRAEQFKEEGRYYDAVQLGTWICKLQPRFPSVWEFVSWNMAWNISVTTYTPEERWNWVYNGARLLRDEGLRYNPRALNMYKQLAWIFINKMGATVDDHHWTYKCNWAWRMHLLLGPPPDPLGEKLSPEDAAALATDVVADPLLQKAERTREQFDAEKRKAAAAEGHALPPPPTQKTPSPAGETPAAVPGASESTGFDLVRKAAIDRIQAIADAPRTLDELFTRAPETEAMVAKLRTLGVNIVDDALTEEAYWAQGGLAWTFFERRLKLVAQPSVRNSISREKKKDQAATTEEVAETRRVEQFDQILGVKAGNPGGLLLTQYMQRKALTEVYRLTPERMLYVLRQFGPVDWRHVASQGLYWVSEALIRGGETIHNFSNDKTNTARLVFFSLRELFNYNKVTFEPDTEKIHLSYLNQSPDVHFIEPMHQAYIRYGPLLDVDPGDDARGAGETFRIGHVNFLTEAIRLLYLADEEAEAQRYFEYLRDTYGRDPLGQPEPRYAKSLSQFVMESFFETIDGPRETVTAIAMLLSLGYDSLADGDVTRYNKLVDKSLELWREYMKEKYKQTSDKLRLPPFQDIQTDVLRFKLSVPTMNPNGVVFKARLWRAAPPNLKRWVYDDLIEGLAAECDEWEFEAARAFPEPEGMKEFRAANPRRTKEDTQGDVETPVQPSNPKE
ncbi:hypothetical protein RAS1_19700 [Phycisphaerae bacterium RAS1]|nr:hypothetical protein RAS1_19700 [Phycisphaerae bacterium RAS1]